MMLANGFKFLNIYSCTGFQFTNSHTLDAGINFSTLENTSQESIKALLCHERCIHLFRYFLSVETDEKKKSKENKDEGANV